MSPPSAPLPLESLRRIPYLQARLLAWYTTYGRDLPWRHTDDPYHILVSEIMLQQTQVYRVIPKYHEFLSIYPTLSALAAAPVADVERLWRPLGYNIRPIRLHQIATYAVTMNEGRLPETMDGLLKLPGIGRYTAGAILSFAFHKDAPILDTNVRRVLARVFHITGDLTRAPASRQLWQLAEAVIPPGKGYLFNQAIMDFGALVCIARHPTCSTCVNRIDCPSRIE